MFTGRTAVVSIVTGEQLGVLPLPKMNIGDSVIFDDGVYEITNVTVYKQRQIVCVKHPLPANNDFLSTLSWEKDW